MKNALLGLTVPILLIFAAASATLVYPAVAQSTTYEISGVVVSDTGAPLSGVQVNGYTYSEDASRSGTSSNGFDTTDEEGRFTLNLAEGRGSISLYYEKWRRGDSREIVVDGHATDLTFTITTPPPKTAIIRGIVLGVDGSPIQGAEVQLSYGCCYAMPAETDAPETAPGSASGSDGVASSPPVEEKSSVELTKPAVMPPYHDDYQVTKTGVDGRFEFEAYGGPRQIVAWATGYAQTSTDVNAKENAVTEVTIRLEKVPERNAVLEGRVVDSVTGVPIAGAHVSVRSLEWGHYTEAQTDNDGRYTIKTLPGWTEVSVNYWTPYPEPTPLASEGNAMDADAARLARPVPTDAQYFALSQVVKFKAGDNDGDFKLEAKPKATVALIGYVVDPDAKKGVEGARVSVWNHENGDWGEAITDATGSFKILVRPGHYSGNAWKDGYLSGATSFIVENSATQRVDLVLPKGTTKWAPCYTEEDCGPVIMYADQAKGASSERGFTSGSAPPAAPPAPGAPQASMGDAPAEGDTAGSGPDNSRSASFSGAGGGLPPYDPSDTRAGATDPRAASEVPAGGVLALLGVLGLGALAMRKRR